MQTGTLNAEIFAVGKWNGLTFTHDDLQAIAEAFSILGDNHRVPLKFGHNNDQPMTDGQPALGWVQKVWVEGDKLLATFADVPTVVMDAIKKKLYRNVSVELDLDVSYKAQQLPAVLSGVALLGADIPAVNILKDLTHYMSRGAGFSSGRRAVFSALAGNQPTKEKHMEQVDKLTAQVAEQASTIATFTADTAELKAENAELVAKVAKFEADAKAKAEAESKAQLQAKRDEVLTILEDGVKGEAITPAQRENFKKVLRIEDDAALTALIIDDVKAMVGPAKKQFGREQGKQDGGKQNATSLRADQELVVRCKEMISKGEAKSFGEAKAIVFARDPELARTYINLTEKE